MANVRKYLKDREKKNNSYSRKIWAHRGRKILFFLIFIGLMLGAGVGYRFYLASLSYTDYDVVSISELADLNTANYEPYDEYVLRYSMDGISCIDKDNRVIWNQAYEIKNPIFDRSDDYVVIAAQKENKLYIYNKSGPQGSITTGHPIIDVSIAGQGVVAVIMADGGTSLINLYNPLEVDEPDLAKIVTSLEGNGYPLDISLSMDGKKMAVSYLNLDSNVMKSSIAFYNFSEVGKSYTEKLVGGFDQYETTIIPEIEFVNNDTVGVFGDDMLSIYKMNKLPELVYEEKLEEKVKTIFFSEEYIGIIFEGNQGDFLYDLQLYNLKGEKILHKALYEDYK
ncbi:MAG: hypothetical protein GX913_02340, partial [Clostridiales bacterium]|nr:hypothetical protein [Clostridiales bacterium]